MDTLIKKIGVCLFCLIVFLSLSEQYLTAESLPNKEYVVGAEDVLEIQVWGNDDLKRTVEISQEGAFTFPLIGKVDAAGLSVFELEQLLKSRLADGYLVNPQVNITVTKYYSQKVIILGEVKKPGSYVIKGKTHISEIISDAEGPTEMAGRTVTITRNEPSQNRIPLTESEREKESSTMVIDLDDMAEGSNEERYFVMNGDSITMSQAPPIYVTGEVNKPGEFRWVKGLTVHQAVSLAGGPTKKGALRRTKIIRTEKGQEKELKPSLSDVVMPYDIIKVPESYF